MGWRDYNQDNLSVFDGDLGPVEVKLYKSKTKIRRKKIKLRLVKKD